MPWNSEANAGFSAADPATLWLPVARNAAEINVDAQLCDPDSTLSLYRQLLRLRTSSAAVRYGDITFLSAEPAHESILAYRRRHGRDCKVIVLNLTDAPAQCDVAVSGTIVFSTISRPGAPVGPHLRLSPNEATVIDVPEGDTT
ncbi:MAG: DUF3459 domain-containing protein [Nocardioidaceae bacterium]|nr:DUF3459 domain-containing protein [Nocardioidaceae bacterium]